MTSPPPGPYGLTGFESFDGETARTSGLTPDAAYGIGGGKGIGADAFGEHYATGWGVHPQEAPTTPTCTVGFRFKNFGDRDWGSETTICSVRHTPLNLTKGALNLNGQRQLELLGWDERSGDLNVIAISTRSIKNDTAYYIELIWVAGPPLDYCDEPTGTGGMSVYVNGQLWASGAGPTDFCPEEEELNPDDTILGVDNFRLGIVSTALVERRHMAFDDVYASYTGSTFGDLHVSELELEADYAAEFTPIPGPTNIGMITEDPHDADDSYNEAEGEGYKTDVFDVVDVLGDTGIVAAVQLHAIGQRTQLVPWRWTPFLEIDSTGLRFYGDGTYLAWGNIDQSNWAQTAISVFEWAPEENVVDSDPIGFFQAWSWDLVNEMRVGYTIAPRRHGADPPTGIQDPGPLEEI